VDYDEVADELYGLHPDEFMAVRNAREQEARADGDRSLAADIKALGKPSTPAWVANQLVRHQREEIESLVELGGLLREAQESFAGDQLKALDVQRRQLVNALTRQARALANELGHPVSTGVATQVEETLRAAMADPDAGAALLAARLTAPLTYSGLGTIARPNLRVVPAPKERAADRPTKAEPRKAERPRKAGAAEREQARREEARRAAEERRRREIEEARRALEEAEAIADEAAEAADVERRAAAELAGRHDRMVDRAEELTIELTRVREETTRLGSERSRAERRREAADRRSSDAERARDRARTLLERLEHADR
jgi:hypothetical protein